MARQPTVSGQLARLGFTEIVRSKGILSGSSFDGIADPDELLEAFSRSADPDNALLAFERVVEAAEIAGCRANLILALDSDEHFRDQFVLILGASDALGEHLARHPDHYLALVDNAAGVAAPTAEQLRGGLVEAVMGTLAEGGTWLDAALVLRVAYRRRLLSLAARDLTRTTNFAAVARELSFLADAVLSAALEMAKTELPTDAPACRIAIVALGKCGGLELNYISDVDVIFVVEPGENADGSLSDEAEALVTGTALARAVMRAANEATPEGAIWEVDPALRPEGKSGALVRTLASHVGYYERWAQTWEFQALLKARFSAGDEALGEAYVDAMMPFVWAAADRPHFVADVQQMRRRVEAHIPAAKSDRELKLGKGGLRDVEFSVQLLQLVHGRSDVMVRSSNTLTALESMATWGYVGREDAAALSMAYRFLRTMEHRLQLYRMRRTHDVPADDADLRRLGRSLGFSSDAASELTAAWQKQRIVVRRLHEKLFYRPLLNAVARLDSGDARLSEEAARERLTALGYNDPQGALRHIEALSSGISRRAAIQRTLLPVLLGWFADAPNPDAGLLAFRRVSETLGATPWYLRMLRDESETAERMAHIMAASQFATELLLRLPDSIRLLNDADDLVPRTFGDIAREMAITAKRQGDPDTAALAVRSIRARELFRIAAAEINEMLAVDQTGHALSDLVDATIATTLDIAIRSVEAATGEPLPTRFCVIAMGRLGGREVGYASDADAMFVHDPLPGVDESLATKAATRVANELRRLLSLNSPDPGLEIDADLRPEGRSGALVRSISSYAAYYSRWSSPWEAQALLRARPLAGDAELTNQFVALVDPLRYPTDGISETDLIEARRLKARMESERLPRGADPALHVKLGRGGLTDVEWVAQLMQMRHGGTAGYESLQVVGTLETLAAARNLGLIDEHDEIALATAWSLATKVRNAIYSATGRSGDQVPTDFRVLSGVAFLLGYTADQRAFLTEDYLRDARHARSVFERLFYGWDAPEEDPETGTFP
ncbi:MAG: glutamate-ammonia-ligase adenylyltransferase [Actinomycetes bacterium]|jgi:glutamate-ammonia-ligase adenylyltransferase